MSRRHSTSRRSIHNFVVKDDDLPVRRAKKGSKVQKKEKAEVSGFENLVDKLFHVASKRETYGTKWERLTDQLIEAADQFRIRAEKQGKLVTTLVFDGDDAPPIRVTFTNRRCDIAIEEAGRLRKFMKKGLFIEATRIDLDDDKIEELREALGEKKFNRILKPRQVITPNKNFLEARSLLRKSFSKKENHTLDKFAKQVRARPVVTFKNAGSDE